MGDEGAFGVLFHDAPGGGTERVIGSADEVVDPGAHALFERQAVTLA